MKEIVIGKNREDKKYCIISFDVTEIEFKIHEDVINEFNNVNSSNEAFHYLVYNDYNEKMMVQCLFDSMETIGYEGSRDIAFPEFCNVKTTEDSDAFLKEKSAKTLVF